MLSHTKTDQSEKVSLVIDKLKRVPDLPTLPHIASQLLQMVYSADCSIPEIGSVIEHDPALTANLLKAVNSPLYGVRHNVTNISRALVLLGLREIVNLVSGLMVFKVFRKPEQNSLFDRKGFWLHSSACAVLSRTIAKTIGASLSGEEFIAGLVHDIGKIVLAQYFHDDFEHALHIAAAKQISLYEAEIRVFNISHAEVGAWIAKKWHLPASIVEAIEYHHAPQKAHNPVLVSIVHTANLLCKVCEIGNSGCNHGYSITDDTGWRILRNECPQIGDIEVEHFTDEVEAEIVKARDFLRISAGA